MPANKKNTSKTAHVLNVITAGKDSSDIDADLPASAEPTTDPVIAPSSIGTAVPVLEVELGSEDLSSHVRAALKAELEETVLPPTQAQAGEPSITAPASSAQPMPVFQTIPIPSDIPQSEQSPSAQQAASHPQQPVSQPYLYDPEDSQYINIMQALVEEKSSKYMQLLGVCSCSRCQADVKALALSHLDPKYIVVRKNQNLPISVYDNHYHAAVTSQIISACRIVSANPRH